MDADTYQRLLLMARNVAVSRPANLVRFCDRETDGTPTEATAGPGTCVQHVLHREAAERLSSKTSLERPWLLFTHVSYVWFRKTGSYDRL